MAAYVSIINQSVSFVKSYALGGSRTHMPKRWSLKPVCLPVPPQERRAGKENRTPRTTLEVLGITTIRYPHGRGGIRTPEKPLCKSGALGHYATRP